MVVFLLPRDRSVGGVKTLGGSEKKLDAFYFGRNQVSRRFRPAKLEMTMQPPSYLLRAKDHKVSCRFLF